MPKLYVIGTPLGNLEDLSFRSLRILGEVGLVAAEDTRTSRKLLTYYGIQTRLISFHDDNALHKIPMILKTLIQSDVALVSEAGVPGISDPGTSLVAAAAEHGFQVVPIPGPSAVTTALSVSGMQAQEFVFMGFLPRKKSQRQLAISSIALERRTLVIFESPSRLKATLLDLLGFLGDRPISVCRELTKLHEEIYRGTISQGIGHFDTPRGEFTLIISGVEQHRLKEEVDMAWVNEELHRLRDDGRTPKESVNLLSIATGLPKRQIYRLWLDLQAKSRGL